jgi:hypothetical protein
MRLSHAGLVRVTAALISVGLMLCLLMSMAIDKHELVTTDCGELTYNFMGTISSANNIFPIGLIWQLVIVLTTSVRLFNAFCYYKFISHKSARAHVGHSYVWTCVAYFMECMFLLAVAVIPSKEYLDVHCCCFAGFCLTAFLHQGLRLYDNKMSAKFSNDVNIAYSRLKRVFLIGSLLLFLAISFSLLHFVGCYDGAYSMFALCEYMYVMYGNVFFHATALRAVNDLNCASFLSLSRHIVVDNRRTPRLHSTAKPD